MRFSVAAASLAMVWSSTAMSANTAILQPTENWALDYGDTQCTAARSFGDAASPIILAVVPSLSANTYKLLVSIPKEGPEFAQESRGSVDFGRGPISAETLYYGRKHVNQSVYQFRVPAAEIASASSASTLTVTADHGANYVFALSDMPALIGGLAKCSADLQRYWNSDGKNVRRPAQTTGGDIRSLFTRTDYPTEALKRESQGRSRGRPAQYQLLVDEKGVVDGCDVLTASGDPVLDLTFCDVIRQKAKFTPAKGDQGESVRSVFTTPTVTWSDENALNSSCTWVTGDASGVINNCGAAQRMMQVPQIVVRQPPPPPPPPPPTQN